MNELIQEFADEAEIYADSIVDLGGEFHPAYTKKLVELIVRECMDVLHDNEMGGYQVNYVLKEHFGVETVDEVEYCPKCDAEWSGTSCGIPDCGWIIGANDE